VVTDPIVTARFRDRVVIITGALGGIGRATAQRFAQEGARLVLVDRPDASSSEAAALAVNDCLALGSPQTLSMACDVAEETQVRRVLDATLEQCGRLEVLINLAGATDFKALVALSAADWQRLLGINLMGAVFFTQGALRVMAPGGAIVNVSSVHAVRTSPLMAPYAAAKAALLSLTRSTALEGRALGVRANSVLPGAIDTPMLWSNPNVASGVEKITAEDVGRPQDVAAAIAFLASAEAAFISGSAFAVDGGRLAAL